MVKNLPAMQETQVQSLGQEEALEKKMETHSSILAWSHSPWGRKESDIIEPLTLSNPLNVLSTTKATPQSFPSPNKESLPGINGGLQDTTHGILPDWLVAANQSLKILPFQHCLPAYM